MSIAIDTSVLDAFERSLERLTDFADVLKAGEFVEALNTSTVEGTLDSVDRLDLARLHHFVTLGGEVELVLSADGETTAVVTSNGSPELHIDPQAGFYLAFADRESALEAAQRGDIASLFSARPDLRATCRMTARNPAERSGITWCRRLAVLTALPWWDLAQRLNPALYPQHVIISSEAGYVLTHSMALGTRSIVSEPLPDVRPDPEFVRVQRGDERSDLPTPSDTAVVTRHNADGVAAMLNGLTHALTWTWLADDVQRTVGTVTLSYRGETDLQLLVNGGPRETATDERALWEWLTDPEQPGKMTAAHRALELSVSNDSELTNAAGRVLRTATYLYKLAQDRRIVEAFAARRAARDQAVSAGRATSDRVRTIARTAVDRVLIQIAAVAGLVVANKAGVLERGPAIVLLALTLIVIGITAAVTFTFEFPSARATAVAYASDLERFADALSENDIADLRNLPSIVSGIHEVTTAMRTAAAVILVAAAIAVGAIVTVSVNAGLAKGSGGTTNTGVSTTTAGRSPRSSPIASTTPITAPISTPTMPAVHS